MKVLVTGAGTLLGQGIIRSLRRSQLDVTIVTVDPCPLSPGVYWADAAHFVPFASAPDFRTGIERILRIEHPDAVLVGTDVELMFFAENRAELEDEFGTKIVVSSPRVVAIADDKWLTAEFLRDSGLPYADSALAGAEEALIERVGFPLVVKPRIGARSRGVTVVNNREELRVALTTVPDPVIQEHLGTAGMEFTAGGIFFEGSDQASIVMRRDLRDGNTYRAYVEEFPELNQQVRRIVEHLQPFGPVNVQFRLHKDAAVTFEINARFSGTTPLRALAGFNEVEMVLRHLLDGAPILQPAVQPMVIVRHWSETIIDRTRYDAFTAEKASW